MESVVHHVCSFILQKSVKIEPGFSLSQFFFFFTALCFKSAIKRVMGDVRQAAFNRTGMTVI